MVVESVLRFAVVPDHLPVRRLEFGDPLAVIIVLEHVSANILLVFDAVLLLLDDLVALADDAVVDRIIDFGLHFCQHLLVDKVLTYDDLLDLNVILGIFALCWTLDAFRGGEFARLPPGPLGIALGMDLL